MQDIITGQIDEKTINAAVSDAVVQLRKLSNNHPYLNTGSPGRKAVNKALQKALKANVGEPGLCVVLTINRQKYEVLFYNGNYLRVVVLKPDYAEAQRKAG